MPKYNINDIVEYNKDIFEEVNGYFEKIKTVKKTGKIFCIELWENNKIFYRIQTNYKTKSFFPLWDYVTENKIISKI